MRRGALLHGGAALAVGYTVGFSRARFSRGFEATSRYARHETLAPLWLACRRGGEKPLAPRW